MSPTSSQDHNPPHDPWQAVEQIVTQIQRPAFPSKQFDLSDFGAKGDGLSDNRQSLQQAIDQCSLENGGRVFLSKGTYLSRGPIRLKSNVDLHLAKGARLKFSGDPSDFLPPVLARWEGVLAHTHSPFIYAFQADNIALTGEGMIDGNAGSHFSPWLDLQEQSQRKIWNQGDNDVPLHERVYGQDSWIRPSFIHFFGCSRVLVEGVTFIDSPFWIIHPAFCRHIVIRGITVDSFRMNNDGIDPDSCSDMLIENSRFRTGDDAIAIKSGRDAEGRLIGTASERIVIRDNHFEQVHNGVAIGSEMSGGVRDIYVQRCKVGHGRNLIYFKSNRGRGGLIENVYLRDIEVDKASISLIRFETDYFGSLNSDHPSTFKHFRIENINCNEVDDIGIWAMGHEDAPLRDIELANISIEKASIPAVIRPGDQVALNNVKINGQAFHAEDALPKLEDTSSRKHSY